MGDVRARPSHILSSSALPGAQATFGAGARALAKAANAANSRRVRRRTSCRCSPKAGAHFLAFLAGNACQAAGFLNELLRFIPAQGPLMNQRNWSQPVFVHAEGGYTQMERIRGGRGCKAHGSCCHIRAHWFYRAAAQARINRAAPTMCTSMASLTYLDLNRTSVGRTSY